MTAERRARCLHIVALSRRTFLGSLGASLLGSQLAGRGSALAGPQPARRLVVFYSPTGTVHRHWRPNPDPTQLGFTAGSVLEPLTGLEQHLTVLDGLNYAGVASHDRGMLHMLTGGPDPLSESRGASLDQFVADHIGGASRMASLQLGVQTSELGATMQSRMSYRRAGVMVSPNDDPRDAHRRIFADLGEDTLALYAKRRSVLDLVRGELHSLKPRLGRNEQVKLDAHLEALRASEQAFTPMSTGAQCGLHPAAVTFDPSLNDNFPQVGRAQMDLMVAALACDLTRVASLQWSYASSATVLTHLGLSEAYHTLSHSDDGNAQGLEDYLAGQRWYAEQFAYLIGRLRDLPEPSTSGSMLDHSIVLWMTELGDSRLHECTDVPVVIAGGASGQLAGGRYLRFQGQPHNRLLTSICRAMGLNNQGFGDASTGTGLLEGLLV